MKTESAVSLAQMKMQDAEANRQIKVMDIQQRAHDAEADRAAKIQEKSMDIAHSLAVHPEAQGSIS
jgi:ABC-type branched-subunit amino acid transport system ATPase component